MQIVIDIPNEIYDYLHYCRSYDEDIFKANKAMQAIVDGIPLPENHGRLSDIDAARVCIDEVVDCEDKVFAIGLLEWALGKRVVVEAADKI